MAYDFRTDPDRAHPAGGGPGRRDRL